jgi:CubicO group peptidase (beta-lactamase class C family)
MVKKQTLPTIRPEQAGLSSERLARLKPAMQKYIDRKWIPSAVMLVAREGKVVYHEAIGYQDCEKKVPAATDTICRLYSNSKAITGLATMILYEDGKLTLDDPLSKYIPAFKNPKIVAKPEQVPTDGRGMATMFATVPAKREITLRDCLRNTTGLATPERAPYWFLTQYQDILPETGWDMMIVLDRAPEKGYLHRAEMYAKLPLITNPGTEFLYHVGYHIVGAIIEIITGKSLEEFYRERIFRPLGMDDTSFYLDKKKLARFSCCYQPIPVKNNWGLGIYDSAETSEKVKGAGKYCGAGGDLGGILSTASDYARFGQMLLNGGELDGVRIISRKSVELMTSSHTKKLNVPMLGEGFGFGIGLGVYTGASHNPVLRSPGTFGWGGAAGTIFFADPKEKLLAICFTQLFNAKMIPDNNYQEEFERLVYQALI